MIEMTVLSEQTYQEGLTLILGEDKASIRFQKEGDDPNEDIYVEVPVPYDQLLDGVCALKSNKPCSLGEDTRVASFIPYGNFQYLLCMDSPGRIGANIRGLRVGFTKQLLEAVAKYALQQLQEESTFQR